MLNRPDIDIRPDHWEIVHSLLEKYVPQYAVWAFGSRAKWTAKDYSDLDLAVITDKPLALSVSSSLSDDFSESDLPYKVDIVDWATTSASFRQIIERDKVEIQAGRSWEVLAMSSEWTSCLLESVLEVKYGKDHKNLADGVIPVYGSGGVMRYADTALYDDESILIPRKGSLNNVIFENKPFWTVDTMFWSKIDKNRVFPKFLFYQLSIIDFMSLSIGSAVPSMTVPVLNALKIVLPPREEQKAIANILSSLDDRISLLRETNSTLEAIAQALFKSWFVDFDPVHAKQQGREPDGMDEVTAALFPDRFDESELGLVPKGWQVGKLGDITESARKQIKPNELSSDLNYVGLEHIPRQSLSLTDWDNAEGLESAKAAFKTGDILFGKLRPYFHKVVIAPFDGVCSTDILVCRPKQSEYFSLVVLQLFSTTLIDYATRLSNGAKMPRINWQDISDYPIAIPPIAVAEAFNQVVRSSFDKIKANVHQIQTLAALRDTLLPRLISGQLRLPEAETMLEEACA